MFQKDQTGKGFFCAAGHSYNRQTELTPRKLFICGSQNHLIAKFPKPPKDNYKQKKQVRFNENGNCACNNGNNNSDQKIYAYMARRSVKD